MSDDKEERIRVEAWMHGCFGTQTADKRGRRTSTGLKLNRLLNTRIACSRNKSGAPQRKGMPRYFFEISHSGIILPR